MKLQKLEFFFVVIAMVCMATILFAGFYLRYSGSSGKELTETIFVSVPLLPGIFFVSILCFTLLKRMYVITPFRLHGWRNGEYAVNLRVYYNGYISGHNDRRVFKASNKETMPATPRWTPVKWEDNSVVVCDELYMLKQIDA